MEKLVLDASNTEGFVDETAASNGKQLEALERVFQKAAEDDTPSEVRTCILSVLCTSPEHCPSKLCPPLPPQNPFPKREKRKEKPSCIWLLLIGNVN